MVLWTWQEQRWKLLKENVKCAACLLASLGDRWAALERSLMSRDKLFLSFVYRGWDMRHQWQVHSFLVRSCCCWSEVFPAVRVTPWLILCFATCNPWHPARVRDAAKQKSSVFLQGFVGYNPSTRLWGETVVLIRKEGGGVRAPGCCLSLQEFPKGGGVLCEHTRPAPSGTQWTEKRRE